MRATTGGSTGRLLLMAGGDTDSATAPRGAQNRESMTCPLTGLDEVVSLAGSGSRQLTQQAGRRH
jgi:hypothetical protein